MSTRDFFRRHIFHNLSLKLTSLLLAFALWAIVMSSPPAEVAVNVPIIFTNMPANLEISSVNAPSAQVRVRGPQALIRRLQASDVSVEVDLLKQGITAGEHNFDLTQDVHVPNRLTVSRVVPNGIHVTFETRATH